MNDDEVKAFEKGKAVDKGSFDLQKNKFLAQHFFAPIKKAREGKNAIILVVSQIRQKIGATMFEKKTTTSNTSVMQFYFDTRLELLPSRITSYNVCYTKLLRELFCMVFHVLL